MFLLSVWCLLCLLINLLPSTLSTTETVENLIGVAGGKVSLPCNITPPTTDDAVSLILWYKDESTTPIYSLDARKGKLDQARHASNDILNSRSYMNIDRRPATFSLEQLQEDDAGEYRCRVDFKKERTRNFVVYLKILVPPDKPIITDGKSVEPLTSLIGPFNEGEKLSLQCEVNGGKPRPTLTWWRESVLLDDSYEIISTSGSGLIRNILEIPVLQRHDLMAVLTCQASNNNISSPQVSSVTVDLNFRPLLVRIQGDNKAFSSGKPSEVTCQTAGSRPAPTINWYLGTTRLKKTREKHSADGNITTSILTFKPSADDTGKHLFCRAENPLIPSSAIEDSWKLTIHYVPQLSLRLGNKLRHSHIQAGNDVYFECIIRSNPKVSEIRWWFEGKELHTNTSAGIIVSNQSLVLQKVQRVNRGRYTCTALNSEGEGESNAVHLRVQFSPVCKERQKALYGAARMESVKIKCDLEADPPDVTFAWSFNNSNENIELTNHSSDGASSIVTYVPKTEYDYGTLFCWGKNSVGSQSEPCVFTVIPAGPPDPLKNCSLVNSSEDSLRVDCTEGYDGGLMQHYIMEVYDSYFPVDLKANISTNWPSFTAKGLPPGTQFTLKIYSVNSKGQSQPETLSGTTLSLPESANRTSKGQVWQLTASPFLLILITVVTIIVVLALLIIMILKLCPSSPRIRKHQGSNGDEKDPKQTTPLRKPAGDEVCDVCTCGDGDDKCPDIIPDIGFNGSETLSRNGDLTTMMKDETMISEKLDSTNPLTAPLLSNSSSCQATYTNGINCPLMETGHQLNHWRSGGSIGHPATPTPPPPTIHQQPTSTSTPLVNPMGSNQSNHLTNLSSTIHNNIQNGQSLL
ncbi:protein turtle homolog B-like isoform X2 [Panonychus citri]|uniref:protein turtle homolog B-like isoform X2 n=1 Tax=Panonychus citri TaxID=50023 RepID=UPI00230776C8|nr:protein turtle homolog B-like isoform X2 [Panonychus citri]